MVENLWDNWLLIAFIAPIFWALVNIIDLYFVSEVYEDEYVGAIVTGFMQFVPWLAVPLFGIIIPPLEHILLAMAGGFFLVVSYFFYFKALFKTSDVTLIQIVWNTIAVVVPVLAFFLLQETLSIYQYAGITVVFAGVMVLTDGGINKKEKIWPVISIMSGAVMFLSLSMVCTRKIYLNDVSFYNIILFYSLGGIVASLFFYLLKLKKAGVGKVLNIDKKYIGWFVFTELVVLGGIMTSQRAIDISPAVSLVSTIESLQPAFIIILSILIFLAFTLFSGKRKAIAEKIYKEQLVNPVYKTVAIIIMAFGIYLINF